MSNASQNQLAKVVSTVVEEMRELNEKVASDQSIGLDQTSALQQEIDVLADMVLGTEGRGTSSGEKYFTFAVGLYEGDARVWVEELMRDENKETALRRLRESYMESDTVDAETAARVAFITCIHEQPAEPCGENETQLKEEEARNREVGWNAVDEARRPGDNPGDPAFDIVERMINDAIDECEPGTEQAYATHVAAMIERYAQNIRRELEAADFQDQI